MKLTPAASFLLLATFPFTMVYSSENCFTGTSAEVIDWCKSNNCCTSDPSDDEYYDNAEGACDSWSSDATVTLCEGSCNGRGSCSEFQGDKYTVHSGSCNDNWACNSLGWYAKPGASITVGRESCNGKDACYFVAAYSAIVTIGDNACVGYHACYDVGESTMLQSLTIGDNTCIGDGNTVCYYKDWDKTDLEFLNINGNEIVSNFLSIGC